MDYILTAVLVAIVVFVGVRKLRGRGQTSARRNTYLARIEQARKESPAEFVIATAAMVAADLRTLPAEKAWPVANQLHIELAAAADVALRVNGAGR